jgi:flagellar basal-body rod protein FlgC
MSTSRIANPVNIAVSGLRAQALRMSTIAGNIANSHTSRAEGGDPYRAREVVLSATPEDGGVVRIDGVRADMATDFRSVYQPGHPDADEDGYVRMPNVQLPVEMMKLTMASRAYQASAATLKRYQEMMNATLELLK